MIKKIFNWLFPNKAASPASKMALQELWTAFYELSDELETLVWALATHHGDTIKDAPNRAALSDYSEKSLFAVSSLRDEVKILLDATNKAMPTKETKKATHEIEYKVASVEQQDNTLTFSLSRVTASEPNDRDNGDING